MEITDVDALWGLIMLCEEIWILVDWMFAFKWHWLEFLLNDNLELNCFEIGGQLALNDELEWVYGLKQCPMKCIQIIVKEIWACRNR